MFNRLRVWVIKRGWCGVWRKEAQQRGQLHWHLLIACPADWPTTLPRRGQFGGFRSCPVDDFEWSFILLQRVISLLWADILGERSSLRGAWEHASQVSKQEAESGWLKYMLDHATKSKQDQVAKDSGRHWGVINRSRMRQVRPDVRIDDWCNSSWAKFLRLLQRYHTPSVSDSRAPFGHRLGWGCKRGRVGRSVWFGDDASMLRLAKWVQSQEKSQ
jgi:hypothetical protein